MQKLVRNYLERRYNEYLNYSKSCCTQARRQSEAGDVLHYSLIQIFEQIEVNPQRYYDMMNREKGKGTELDCFFRTMINRNILSPRSNYNYKMMGHRRHECTGEYIDNQIIEDEPLEKEDPVEYIQSKQTALRQMMDKEMITGFPRRIFEWKYFHCRSIDEWEGRESRTRRFQALKKVTKTLGLKDSDHSNEENQLTMFY